MSSLRLSAIVGQTLKGRNDMLVATLAAEGSNIHCKREKGGVNINFHTPKSPTSKIYTDE